MRRVYLIWFVKKAMPYFIAEIALISGSLYFVAHYVFVAKVMQYMGQILANNSINPIVWSDFVFHALWQTEFIVQLSVFGFLLMSVLLLKNFASAWAQLVLARQETNLAKQSLHN